MSVMLFYVSRGGHVVSVGPSNFERCRGRCRECPSGSVMPSPEDLAKNGCVLGRLMLGQPVTEQERAGCTFGIDFERPSPPIPRDAKEHSKWMITDPDYAEQVLSDTPEPYRTQMAQLYGINSQ